jgi:hypothetical protein
MCSVKSARDMLFGGTIADSWSNAVLCARVRFDLTVFLS